VPRHVALRCNVVRLYALQRGALCCNVVRLYALQRDAMYCVRCNIGCGRESTLQRLGRHRAAPSTHAHGPQYPSTHSTHSTRSTHSTTVPTTTLRAHCWLYSAVCAVGAFACH
jgi:hypothetical protein